MQTDRGKILTTTLQSSVQCGIWVKYICFIAFTLFAFVLLINKLVFVFAALMKRLTLADMKKLRYKDWSTFSQGILLAKVQLQCV